MRAYKRLIRVSGAIPEHVSLTPSISRTQDGRASLLDVYLLRRGRIPKLQHQ